MKYPEKGKKERKDEGVTMTNMLIVTFNFNDD